MDYDLSDIDWDQVASDLDARGWALVPGLLDATTCGTVAAWYSESSRFRSRIVMSRHGFGRGEYQYFADPLPPLVQSLREELYEGLVEIANRWHEQIGHEERFAATHDEFRRRCHADGQTRPTPLLLQYEPATTTACTRIFTARTFFRSRSRACSRRRRETSRAASSC